MEEERKWLEEERKGEKREREKKEREIIIEENLRNELDTTEISSGASPFLGRNSRVKFNFSTYGDGQEFLNDSKLIEYISRNILSGKKELNGFQRAVFCVYVCVLLFFFHIRNFINTSAREERDSLTSRCYRH